MKLDKLYSLRSTFVIIGLTGRVGSGCSIIANTLSNNDILDISHDPINDETLNQEEIKRNICYQFLRYGKNWQPFQIINYKNVLLLHVLFECVKTKSSKNTFIKILCQNENNPLYTNRFTKEDDGFFEKKLIPFLSEPKSKIFISRVKKHLNGKNLLSSLKEQSTSIYQLLYDGSFKAFADKFYETLNKEPPLVLVCNEDV